MKTYMITQNDAADLQHMRNIRKDTVFPIINRGKLWYDGLTEQQLLELNIWYEEWLNYSDTKIVPIPPNWLESEVNHEIRLDLEN